MCKELNEELQQGEQLAKNLANHLENMGGAAKAEIPIISSSGKKYIVTVELQEQKEYYCPNCSKNQVIREMEDKDSVSGEVYTDIVCEICDNIIATRKGGVL